MKVNIVLPFFPKKAVGGIKIMYQYADFLKERGHRVIIYHAKTLKNSPTKYLNSLRVLKQVLNKKNLGPAWFKFNNHIEFRTINRITENSIEDGDAIFSTMYATALDVFELSAKKGKKINVIQDYETWISTEEKIISSYRLPIQHIVINDYLFQKVKNVTGIDPLLVYNAISNEHFRVVCPIHERYGKSICMLYSEEKRKGSEYGIEAIKICKGRFPDLKVIFFSVYSRNNEIPDWVEFHQSPSNLEEIYNRTAIFFSPSNAEGWALPPAEAMSCGCAVVCTDIDGHAAYAIDDKTAKLVKCRDSSDMAEKLISLIEDENLRIEIAKAGNVKIKEFTWTKAIDKLENAIKK